jgi:predicted transcriptional regulator
VSDCSDILISLSPIHTGAILSGKKTVELRRRRLNIRTGTRVWIYSKVPVGSVEATAVVDRVCHADLDSLWREFHQAIAISRNAFDKYFAGCAQGCAVVLREVSPVTPAMELAHLRAEFDGFHPPQFFKRLRWDEMNALLARIALGAATQPVPLEGRSLGYSP